MTGNDWLSGPLRQSMIAAAEGRHDDSARLFAEYKRATLAFLTRRTEANPQEAADERENNPD